jgi:hypothetical protein
MSRDPNHQFLLAAAAACALAISPVIAGSAAAQKDATGAGRERLPSLFGDPEDPVTRDAREQAARQREQAARERAREAQERREREMRDRQNRGQARDRARAQAREKARARSADKDRLEAERAREERQAGGH